MLHTMLCCMYGQTQIFLLFPPYIGLIGSKSSGICRNFIICIIIPYFVHNMVSYVWSNTKVILFHHWFGTLAVNAGAIIEISINSHQLPAIWFILSNQVNKS